MFLCKTVQHLFLFVHFRVQKLKFNSDDLRKNLSFCERDAVIVKSEDCFINYEEAQELVTSLWPLKKEGEEKDSPMQSMAGTESVNKFHASAWVILHHCQIQTFSPHFY